MSRLRGGSRAEARDNSALVKLLLDQNLSFHLARDLRDLFPESAHVRDIGLQSASDDEVWSYAADHGFVIVSKDADFHQKSFVYGAPPKVVWIRRGNCSTGDILGIIRARASELVAFEADTEGSFLALE